MTEVWLRNNNRVFMAAMIAPGIVEVVGLVLIAGAAGHSPGWRIAGGILVALASTCLVALFWQMTRPRLALRNRDLLVYLRWSGPLPVPLELVEGFLLGQGPSRLRRGHQREPETTNVIVRLAEKAPEWARVDVDPLLGNWCGHYITIRGTFCEPISVDLVNRLNARLHEATHASGRQEVP